tara:strand:+ start:4265 stop:5251 length:987 start_codon:yes stop_codon:yes gene_type:complete
MDLYKNIREEDIYTWPNPHFPFKCLLEDDKCRIFILENISHNYSWLKQYKDLIRETDFFFVSLGWHLSPHLANQGRCIIDQLNLNLNNFFILYNCPQEERNGAGFGLQGEVINHNAWLDESNFNFTGMLKKYNALYIARPTDFKRHYLAANVKKLALAAGGHNHRNLRTELPPCENDPFKRLTKDEICEIINISKCGLSLSREEGACYSSSEYLLCGVPVVSTRSKGGRDVWYNEDNSIICDDTKESVALAVEDCIGRRWDGPKIRLTHQQQAQLYKDKFLAKLKETLRRFGALDIDATRLFYENFRWYCNPNSNATPHIDTLNNYFK